MCRGYSLVVVILFLFLVACAPQAAPVAPSPAASVPDHPQFRLGPEVKIIDYTTTDWTNRPN